MFCSKLKEKLGSICVNRGPKGPVSPYGRGLVVLE